MQLNLQKKLLALMTPLIVAPLLALGWVAFVQVKQIVDDKAVRQMSTLLQQVGLHVEHAIRTTKANTDLFSNSMLVQKYMLASEQDRYSLLQPTLIRQFESYRETYPEYERIRIVLPDGFVDTSVSDPLERDYEGGAAEEPHFQSVLKHDGAVYSVFDLDQNGTEFGLYVARRISLIDRANNPLLAEPVLRGFLTVRAKLEFLEDQITTVKVGNRGFLFATDQDGKVILSPPDGLGAASLDRKYIPEAPVSWNEIPTQQVRLRGEAYLLQAYAAASDLKLYAALPVSELHASSHVLGAAVGGITVFAILLTTSLLYFTAKRHFITPIQKLGVAAREIGQGNLRVEISHAARDELGELADAFRDMRDSLEKSHERVHYLAYHDSVTGLANRLMFREYLQETLQDASQSEKCMALLFLDLDNFKRINDTLGHHAGDELLQELAWRLSSCVREGDYVGRPNIEHSPELVARLGGDEFVLVLPNVGSQEVAAMVADRILTSFSAPVKIQDQDIHVSSSIGITLYPQDGNDAATLIKNADIAMYHAKAHGKKNYQFFSEAMEKDTARQLQLESRLRTAITNGGLALHYQPILDAHSQEVVGAEALVRWNDAELGQVYPDAFIPLAEQTGLIVPLGEWVLTEACRQCREWHDKGYGPLTVSVNLSAVQIQQADILETVRNTLQQTDLPAASLELELTETSLLQVQDAAVTILNSLNELGVSLALDDFGTGYSSLTYLKRFNFDRLKIDRSFVRDLQTDDDNAAICSAIIAMAHKLGVGVTAEGVETADQSRQLTGWSCDHLQGYFFSKPVANQEFERYVRENTPAIIAKTAAKTGSESNRF